MQTPEQKTIELSSIPVSNPTVDTVIPVISEEKANNNPPAPANNADIESGSSNNENTVENEKEAAEKAMELKLKDPNYRTNQANLTSWVGLVVDITLTICKYIMGVLGNSSAMVADAIHSCTDLVTDVVAIFVMTAAKKPADADHPYGHGRYEIAGSVFIAIMLIGVGAFVGYEGIAKLIAQDEQLVEYIALIAAVISIVCKELLFWFTYLIGKKINSPVIIANAWHHRSDAISSIVALIGIGLNLWLKWWWADPVAGMGVALMIIFIGGRIGYQSICSLSDHMAKDTITELKEILDTVECEGYSHLRAREMGPYLIVDVTLYVHPGTHVEDCELLSKDTVKMIKDKMANVMEVLVHVTTASEELGEDVVVNENSFTSQIEKGISSIPGFGKIEQIRVYGPAPYSVDLHISADGSQSPTQQIQVLKDVKKYVTRIQGIGETHISIENLV